MKSRQQLSFLPGEPALTPDYGRSSRQGAGQARQMARSEGSRLPGPDSTGFPVDPEEQINSIDDAVEHLGRELGRLGTVLKRVNDYGLLGSFSQLYAVNITRYADLLLKKKMLEDQPADPLLELLGPALDRLNQTVELEL